MTFYLGWVDCPVVSDADVMQASRPIAPIAEIQYNVVLAGKRTAKEKRIMSFYSAENIPYIEFGVITELLREHPKVHRDKLRALLVFGSLVSSGHPYDINLLEVVQDWEGPRHVRFTSTETLPLRGRLNLYFLRPEEFERPSHSCLPGEHWSSADLLTQARNSYTILLENPSNYASDVMAQYESSPSVADNETSKEDPISFLKRQENVLA